ncbi:MAG: hypothetical protein AseanaTS_09000 [Candidatus Pelagadaptatus aseana]|uniref:flagellar brake protein n=1 Tax=Candidatus Pelagadaptatus aseana TaxID=3120508 RepID=UPI0039B198FD
MKFDDLSLVPGNRLQLQFKKTPDSRENSFLVGYRSGRSILITTPEISNGSPRSTKVGEQLNVRLFSSKTNSAAAFTTQVSHVSVVPFPHLHLSYPQKVDTDEVRKAARVATNLKTVVEVEGEPIGATIVDLSTSGCRVESDQPLGQPGETINLLTYIQVADTSRRFPLPAEIKNQQEENGIYKYGMAFSGMSEEITLILHAYVYYQLYR